MRLKKMLVCAGVLLLLIIKTAMASPDGWINDKRMTSNASQSLYPSITCDALGNSVFVVWTDDRDGCWQVYFRRSFDQGLTWSSAANITNNPVDAVYPTLYWYSPNILLLTWLDYRGGSGDIYTMRSLDDGTTWTDLQGNAGQITAVSGRGNPGASFSRPRAVINPFGTHVVWADNTSGSSKIYYRNVTVAAVMSIKPDSPGATLPAIATLNYGMLPDTTLYIAWEDSPGASSSIYFTRSANGGVTWTDGSGVPGSYDISFKFGGSAARHPDIFVCGDTAAGVDVAFLDDRQGSDQVYWEAGRTNAGLPITWDDGMATIGFAPNTLTTAAIAPDWLTMSPRNGSHQSVVWQDNRDSNLEIYIREGQGGGAIMFTPETRLTYDAGDSILPAIIVNDVFAGAMEVQYIVWADNRDSNYEIYYKRSDPMGPNAVTDLAAATGSNPGEVDLIWTAPADDVCDPVQLYDIGHDNEAIINLWDFRNNAAKVTQSMVPQSAGQVENYTVTGLVPGNQYYFAVISVDEAGNSSTVSNSPQAAACGPFTATPTSTVSTTHTTTPTVTVTFTITSTGTSTLTSTPTPTATITPSIAYKFSGLDKTILAPVPARAGAPVCLYFKSAPIFSKWTVFNTAGERVAHLEFTNEVNQCWLPEGIAPGIYFVKLEIELENGRKERFIKKIVIIK